MRFAIFADSLLGNPGTGKTVLAASTIDELNKPDIQCNEIERTVCFYFFSYVTRGKTLLTNAYRSILAQILHQYRQDESMLDLFLFARSNAKSGQKLASEEDLIQLLESIPRRISNLYLVLDGIDESENPETFVKTLNIALKESTTKMVFFSRPNVQVLRRASKLNSITVKRSLMESDLRIFFTRHVERLQNDPFEQILPTTHSCDFLVDHLLSGANGMFLWARLMIGYLESTGLTPASRIASITALKNPEKLEEMYIRILKLISGKIKEEVRLARRVFLWLTFQRERSCLDAAQLQDVVTPLSTRNSNTAGNQLGPPNGFVDFENTIVMVCASLVEFASGRYQFIHQSALEFFKNPLEYLEGTYHPEFRILHQFLVTELEGQSEICEECLEYLLYRVPAQPLSGDMRAAPSRSLVNEAFPFLIYASTNWTHHLSQSSSWPSSKEQQDSPHFARLLQVLSRFLSNKLVLMSWIESRYLFLTEDFHLDILAEMRLWSLSVQDSDTEQLQQDLKNVSERVISFSKDLKIIHDLWGSTLCQGPHHIWNDVTAFTKSKFLLQTSTVSVNSMAPSEIGDSCLSSKPLSTISVEAFDGKFLGVLSIWPTK